MALKPDHGRILADESGGATSFLIIWMIAFFIFGGLAVDSSNAWRQKAVLQATADAAAHAAIVDLDDQSTALAKANQFAEVNMPASEHGDVLFDSDVEFGEWDGNDFTPQGSVAGGGTVNAVRVTTYRNAAHSNSLQAYFLTLAGFGSWDISARAIAARYKNGTCLNYENVIMAEGQIHLRPGSTYAGELCVHSNDHIRPQPDVSWGEGTYASMPDEGFDSIFEAFNYYNSQIASSWDPETEEYGKGPGLADALVGNNHIDLQSNYLSTMVSSVYAGESTYLPEAVSITDMQTIVVGTDPIPETLISGTQYNFDCGGLASSIGDLASVESGGATDFAGLSKSGAEFAESLFGQLFAAQAGNGNGNGGGGNGPISVSQNKITFDLDLENVVVVTDCAIHIHSGIYTNTLFATTAGNQAVQFSHNDAVQVGADDNCAPGGDTHFLAPNGDIHSAAKASFFDAKFIGGHDYHLAAKSKGETATGAAVGINAQVSGEADITALAVWTGCGDEDGENYAAWGYRLVR